MTIDFAAIRADNPIAETVNRYIELRRQGGEYLGRCPFHNDSNPSFYVVPTKGKAFCMSCGWHGDVVDFVAEFDSITPAEAARKLSGGELPDSRPALAPMPEPEADWAPVMPAPQDAPELDLSRIYNPRAVDRATNKSGRFVNWKRAATRCDPYLSTDGRPLGYVVRMEIDGQKLTPTVTWARHRDGRECWASVKFPNPRPLQGLDDLARRPEAGVLVVSGEKCREAAAKALPGFVVVTWPGGDQNVLRADWRPLYGRRVTLWPDADTSGLEACQRLAAALHGHAREVRVIDPAGQPKGWDIADAVADGWDRDKIVAWVKPRVSVWAQPNECTLAAIADSYAGRVETAESVEALIQKEAPVIGGSDAGAVSPREGESVAADGVQHNPSDAVSATLDPHAPNDDAPWPQDEPARGEIVDLPNRPESAAYTSLTTWSALGLALSDKGVPNANLDNAARLLERHPEVEGQFWFDEFLGRILTTWTRTGDVAEWSDADDVRLALWMQRKLGIGRMAVGTARDAVTAVAMAHTRNECREWLSALRWDGRDRLDMLVPHGFGAEENPYTQAVGRCWLVSMVARVFDPGCKVDTMPVFEGAQGIRKSTAMQTLVGGRWFAESSESPTSKDFYQVLQGKLLVEIAEMDAFSRAEVNTIKRVVTCRVDRYRAPYGRRAEDHPRMSVFAGTTNKDDWNRDETGARRFWPVACTAVDIDWLEAQREQMFAEAVARYQAGEPWWDVPDEDAKREQEARRDADEWEGVIGKWLVGRQECAVGDVLGGALNMEIESWDKGSQMRVGKCLRALGWTRETLWRGGKAVKVWVREPSGKGGNDKPL